MFIVDLNYPILLPAKFPAIRYIVQTGPAPLSLRRLDLVLSYSFTDTFYITEQHHIKRLLL